jgi:hypothetical protein
MFQQFKNIMRREFPHAQFDGAVLSPGWLAEAGAQALSLGFFGTIVLIFAGEYALPPRIAAGLSENKGAAFFTAMGMNMAAGKLISTGGFEILVNGIPIHSKVFNVYTQPLSPRATPIDSRRRPDRALTLPVRARRLLARAQIQSGQLPTVEGVLADVRRMAGVSS